MRFAKQATILAAVGALAACAVWAKEEPAVLLQTERNHATLQAAVAKLLHVESVRLAEDALTREDILAVEHARPRDVSGALLQGRELQPPEQFRLVRQDGRCTLIRERTGQRQPLRGVTCRAPHVG